MSADFFAFPRFRQEFLLNFPRLLALATDTPMAWRVKRSPTVTDPDERLSKTLSYFLRHGAIERGLPIAPDGFIPLDSLLCRQEFCRINATEADIRRLASTGDYRRFLIDEGPPPRIKAITFHSIPEVNQLSLQPLQPILTADEALMAVKGVGLEEWEYDVRTEGLKAPDRNYIHFAPSDDVTQGASCINTSKRVFVYIDVARAMAAGIEFFRAENGLILSKGLNGCIPPTFFIKALDRQCGDEMALNH